MKKEELVQRNLQKILYREAERRIISTVIGPRQVGKTTLLHQIAEEISSSGVPDKHIIFLNFDDIEIRSRLSRHPAELSREIEIRLGRPLSTFKEKIYLFLDEAQKVPLLFDIIKLIFEKWGDRVKIFLSGSSSIEIQKRTAETLAGRIRYHYLFPLTLKEIITHYGFWKGSKSPFELMIKDKFTEKPLKEIQSLLWENRDSINSLRKKMLLFGSLPGVYLEPSEDERWYLLRDYVSTYIEKDIRLIEGVGNLYLFHRLYQALLLQHGQILNASNLAGDLGMSRNTTSSYLNILEQTFILYRLSSFALRPKSRLMKAPKIYFFDPGLVNHGLRQTSLEALKASRLDGFLEEGIFLFQLLAFAREMSIPPQVYYLRDYQGHEIDFVMEGNTLTGIEVTTEDRVRKKRYLNIKRFSEELKIEKMVIVGRFQQLGKESIGKTKVILLPSWMAW